MHKVSQFVKHHLNVQQPHQPAQDIPQPTLSSPFPMDADMYRFRKQRGVNLGSWFVLERWITDAPFRYAAGSAQSDLDIARGSNAKAVLEHHWDTWITEPDWEWIVQRGINTVRLPIGFYHICGVDASVLQGTDFADFHHVFEGAWDRIMNAMVAAQRHGLGVLLDLHAAPGKQNVDTHSGSSESATFFTNPYNMPHTIHVLTTLLSHLTEFARPPLTNLVGIELLNEPQSQGHNNALERWYIEAFRALRAIDPGLPLYIGDGWMMDQYADFIVGSQIQSVILDHHLYRCFTPQDISAPVAEHTRALTDPNSWAPQMFARVAQKLEAAGCSLIVGEWSGGLNPGSLRGVDERQARRDYLNAQLQLYDRWCSGWFFWTYKNEHGDLGWSFRDAVTAGLLSSWVGMRPTKPIHNKAEVNVRRNAARDKVLAEHTAYWQQYRGRYEHWRFGEGFIMGWNDAWIFFESHRGHPTAPIAELGFKGPWIKRRAKQHAVERGDSNIWEFEHGLSQGVAAARDDFQSMYC